MAAEKFKKIHEPKTSKFKGRFAANAILIFKSWFKVVDICMQKWKLSSMEVVQLMKDYYRPCQECCVILFRYILYVALGEPNLIPR